MYIITLHSLLNPFCEHVADGMPVKLHPHTLLQALLPGQDQMQAAHLLGTIAMPHSQAALRKLVSSRALPGTPGTPDDPNA